MIMMEIQRLDNAHKKLREVDLSVISVFLWLISPDPPKVTLGF